MYAVNIFLLLRFRPALRLLPPGFLGPPFLFLPALSLAAIFEIGDLEPDIYFTIDTMEIGDISSPIEYLDPRGEKLFKIILLQSRTDPHKASLGLDYAKIQKAAINEKKSLYIADWIDGKIGATFIDIDKEYGDCEVLQKWTKEDIKP